MKLGVTKASASSSYNGLGDQLYDLGGARPTLDLNFSSNGSLVDSVTGKTLVDHTRQSSATYVDGDGVIRTAVTNLLLRSEEFNDAAWAGLASNVTVTANTATAPNGTITADTLDVTNASSYRFQTVSSLTAGTTYTFSVWLASATKSTIGLRIAGTSTATGVALLVNLTPSFARYSISVTLPAGNTGAWVGFENRTGQGGDNTTGTFYAWGAQLEQSSTVGQYVKTTSTKNGAPRFDHDPTTGESLGLLVEESRQNLLVRSEDFSTTWANLNSTEQTNAENAPDGTLTADKLVENIGAGFKSIYQEVAISALTYTFSVYVKVGERSIVQLLWSGGASTNFANFDLSTGLVTAGTYTSATITSINNGWFRLSITSTLASGNYAPIISLQTNSEATRASSYTGDGTSGIYIWGAQLEVGSFPTSYIPTEGSTVTRAADVTSITGTNFSSWYRQDEGTVFVDSQRPFTITSGFQRIFSINDGSGNNETNILWGSASSKFYSAIISGGAASADIGFFSQTQTISQRGVVGYKVDSFGFTANGQVPATDTLGPVPVSVNRLEVGQFSSAGQFNGTIRRLTYWPTRLSNDTLQTITR